MWKKENDVKKFLKSLNVDTSSPACSYFIMSVLIAGNGNISLDENFENEVLRQVSNWYDKDLSFVRQEIKSFIENNSIGTQLFIDEKKIGNVLCEIAQRIATCKI